jgi:hypothetical protein
MRYFATLDNDPGGTEVFGQGLTGLDYIHHNLLGKILASTFFSKNAFSSAG